MLLKEKELKNDMDHCIGIYGLCLLSDNLYSKQNSATGRLFMLQWLVHVYVHLGGAKRFSIMYTDTHTHTEVGEIKLRGGLIGGGESRRT